MLKFLNNRNDDKPPRSPIKYHPEMIYGISFEAPKEFQSQHSIIYRKSYLNPFLRFDQNRKSKLRDFELKQIQPHWAKKTHLHNVEEHKILSQSTQIHDQEPPSRYAQSFHRELSVDPNRFRMTKGEFSSFIQKNNHYKSIGPLHGVERDEERIRETKKSVWFRQPSKKEEMTSSLKYASSMNTTFKSSIGQNSELLTEKHRIRRHREKIQKQFRGSLQNRKALPSHSFHLPSKGPEHEIFLLEDLPRMPKIERFSLPSKDSSVGECELEAFEKTIDRKFK